MHRLKTLFWGIYQLIALRLTKRKVLPNEKIVKKTFNFVGSARRPHPGMKLFSSDPSSGNVEQVIIIKNHDGSNGFINPDLKHVWTINKRNAIKKFNKDESTTI